MAEAIFWVAVGLCVWVYALFPALVFALSHLRPRPARRAAVTPPVSFIVCAYNEEAAIAAKLDSTLALDYPADRLEVVVASDGSTDRTEEIVRTQYANRVRLLAYERIGKTTCQNRAAEAATGEVLVFSDATTICRPDSIRELMKSFADPEVGCAGGWVTMGVDAAEPMHEGRRAYGMFENRMRRWESRIHSTLGVPGAFYAVRRLLYTPLPADVISDMVQAIKVVEQGYRTVLDEEAAVLEPGESRTLADELARRRRVALRGLRGHVFVRSFLNPFRNPWFFLQAVSRRLLRWAVPIFMLVAFVASAFLLDRPFYAVAFLAQLSFYGAALIGWFLERRGRRPRLFFLPLYFCVVNLAPLLALIALLRGERRVTWDTAREATAPAGDQSEA